MNETVATDDDLIFAAEDSGDGHAAGAPWRLLVVDDEPEIHTVTRVALREFQFDGRRLEILDAASAAEARALMEREQGIAALLLDVVMETESAGLNLVRHIRQERRDAMVRILLRTGQPGQAPQREVVRDYEINDYLNKSELTADKLSTALSTALRSYRDLQARRAHEEALERACRRLERFAEAAAHDLKEPLRGILGFSQLLARGVGQLASGEAGAGASAVAQSKVESHLAFLRQSVTEMQNKVDGLHAFALSRTGLLRRERVDLGRCVATVRQILESRLGASRAKLEVGALPQVQGDAEQLTLLFRYVLDNALKFREDDRTPQIRITALPEESGWAHVVVADNGIGVDPRYADKMFGLFRRLNPPERFPGTGVGLALCTEIAERHGGRVWAEAQPVGLAIHLRLPLVAPIGGATTLPQAASASRG